MPFPLTRPILFCLLVVALWFSPWWIGGKNLAPLDITHQMMEPWREGNTEITAKNHIVSDSVTQYLVYRMIAAEDYRREGWVGWSSLTYGGTAQHANTMALYGDWTMQLHRWFDFWTAWHLGLMGQVILAAAGMLLWLRGRGVAAGWAICGALLYAANSQFVTWINHRWALSAFCWVPWILWSIDAHRMRQTMEWLPPGSHQSHRRLPSRLSALCRFQVATPTGFFTPAFIALAFLGGTLQHMALVALVVIAIWLEEALSLHSKFKIQNSKFGLSAQLRLLGRYLVWGLVALAFASPVWLPAAEGFLTTNRLGIHTGLHGRHDGIYPLGPLQPLFNLSAYPGQIFPSIFGRSDSLDLLKLFKSDLFYVIYFGSLPVLIGFLAAWSKRVPLAARILILAGLILPLTPLVRLLYQRLYLLFILGGIYAFVHWMQHAGQESKRRLLRWCGWATAAATGCWLLLSAAMQSQRVRIEEILHTKVAGMGDGSSFGFFQDWMRGRTDHAIQDLFIWSPHHFVPLVLWLAILAGLWISLAPQGCGRDGCATWYERLARSLPPKTGHAMIGIAVVLEVTLFASKWITWTDSEKYPLFPETAESQLLRDHVGRDGRTTTLPHPAHHMARTPFVPNTIAAYRIPSIRGYDSIVPDGINLVTMQTADPQALGKVGVTHLITWPGNPDVPDGWRELDGTASMTLYQNPYAVPRYAGIIDGQSDWIALDEKTGLENRREINLVPGLSAVRIAENHATGWQFRTGEASWSKISRADDGSMFIPLSDPAATTLELRYRPPLRRAGFALAVIAALVWIAVAAIAGRRQSLQR